MSKAIAKTSVSNESFFTLREGINIARLESPWCTQRLVFFVRGSSMAAPLKSLVISAFSAMRHAPLVGPVEMNLQFLFQRPKKDAIRFWRDNQPTLNNLDKSVLTALTLARAWLDDAQVVRLQSLKRYALPDEVPGVHIEIASLHGAEVCNAKAW